MEELISAEQREQKTRTYKEQSTTVISNLRKKCKKKRNKLKKNLDDLTSISTVISNKSKKLSKRRLALEKLNKNLLNIKEGLPFIKDEFIKEEVKVKEEGKEKESEDEEENDLPTTIKNLLSTVIESNSYMITTLKEIEKISKYNKKLTIELEKIDKLAITYLQELSDKTNSNTNINKPFSRDLSNSNEKISQSIVQRPNVNQKLVVSVFSSVTSKTKKKRKEEKSET
jgi:hypothetical protein